jgi:hypothetical protein
MIEIWGVLFYITLYANAEIIVTINAERTFATCITLPRTLKARIDAYKETTGVPQAALIRLALMAYLDQRAPQTEEKKEQIAA